MPPRGGLYLLDVVPDGEVRFGFPNINDNAEAAELMACGAHMILFTTGRGSVVGSAISPIIKVCANPETYARMSEDMDVNAGRILHREATIEEVGTEIFELGISQLNSRGHIGKLRGSFIRTDQEQALELVAGHILPGTPVRENNRIGITPYSR